MEPEVSLPHLQVPVSSPNSEHYKSIHKDSAGLWTTLSLLLTAWVPTYFRSLHTTEEKQAKTQSP